MFQLQALIDVHGREYSAEFRSEKFSPSSAGLLELSQALDQIRAEARMWAIQGAQAEEGICAVDLLETAEMLWSEAQGLGEANRASWKNIRCELQVMMESSHPWASRCATDAQGGIGDWLDEPAGIGVPGTGINQQRPQAEQQPDPELAGARPVEGPRKKAGKAVPVAARKSRNECG